MTWPTAPVTTSNVDAGTDSPSTARGDFLDLINKINAIIAYGEPLLPSSSLAWDKVTGTPTTLSGYGIEDAILAASSAETQAGTNSTKAVTPAGLAASMLGGVGQSLQDVMSSRALNGTYWNYTGRPITVYVSVQTTSATTSISAYKNATVFMQQGTSFAGIGLSITFVVKPGESYGVTGTNVNLTMWKEDR